MGYPEKKDDKKYTYSDYIKWPDDQQWEIIEGTAYNMSPAPSRTHQKVTIAILNEFYNYLKGKPCEVYSAPFDVRLPTGNEEDDDIETVVQPDIAVICDKSKLDERGCKGSPDLIVEVVSPSTASVDYIKKLNLYEKHKVREYWIVHPVDKIVMVYSLLDNKYGRPENFSMEDKVKVKVLGDLIVDLKGIFEGLQ
ncbi:MAG: Uma2 family endonuclease [Clostridia bacterium]|nr:Uma2 family endonuclease [Clostridia bacterium]